MIIISVTLLILPIGPNCFMIKLLSVQPVSIYRNGGASRLLRRLYAGYEHDVVSIGISENTLRVLKGDIPELIIKARPVHRSWMRWKMRNLVIWLREKALRNYTIAKIQKAAAVVNYDVIHLICHGPYTMAVYRDNLLTGKQLWTSYHDHFAAAGTSFQDTKLLWTNSARRLVISEQMGQEYCRLFGDQNFEKITDGVLAAELSEPVPANVGKPLTIYFSGLLHIEYYPLFEVLADALDRLSINGRSFTLQMRGTQTLDFLSNRKFGVEYLSDFITDSAIKKEMDAASILYLPIKFNDADFYLYSLSTKMVGYLSASGTILYHGPADSAANILLSDAKAAISCTTLQKEDMVNAIESLLVNNQASANAKELARQQFDMNTIRKQFWQE